MHWKECFKSSIILRMSYAYSFSQTFHCWLNHKLSHLSKSPNGLIWLLFRRPLFVKISMGFWQNWGCTSLKTSVSEFHEIIQQFESILNNHINLIIYFHLKSLLSDGKYYFNAKLQILKTFLPSDVVKLCMDKHGTNAMSKHML